MQTLAWLAQAAQLVALHKLHVPPNALTEYEELQLEQKLGCEHCTQLGTLHSKHPVPLALSTNPVWHCVHLREVQAVHRMSKLVH